MLTSSFTDPLAPSDSLAPQAGPRRHTGRGIANLLAGVVTLGALAYTNTLNDGLAWNVTLASTDWINGTAGHALDYDDVGVRGHPSTVLVPTILAEAEAPAGGGG